MRYSTRKSWQWRGKELVEIWESKRQFERYLNSAVVHVRKAGFKVIPIPIARRCNRGGFREGSEERRIELTTDNGHGAACLPASINE